jgi:hypothetical protein
MYPRKSGFDRYLTNLISTFHLFITVQWRRVSIPPALAGERSAQPPVTCAGQHRGRPSSV